MAKEIFRGTQKIYSGYSEVTEEIFRGDSMVTTGLFMYIVHVATTNNSL